VAEADPAGGPAWRRWPPILGGLSWRDRWLLAQTVAIVSALPLVFRIVGVQRLIRSAHRRHPSSKQVDLARARAIARIVAMGARHTPSDNTCLHRSVALWWCLGRRGLESTLKMGARHHDGRLDAHAWVEHAGLVLNDDPDVARRYAPLPFDVTGAQPLVNR
jgi:hypothetical protein